MTEKEKELRIARDILVEEIAQLQITIKNKQQKIQNLSEQINEVKMKKQIIDPTKEEKKGLFSKKDK